MVGYLEEYAARITKAKETSMVELSKMLGFTPVRAGRCYTLKEHDSVRIYNDRTWCRWSDKTGGSQIDFLMTFGNCGSIGEAVNQLLDLQGIRLNMVIQREEKVKEQKPFELPPKAENYKRMFAYLMQVRKLSYDTVSFCVRQGILYEEALHHNCVFVGRDKDGVPRHATCRGTNTYRKFVGDVEGNNKNYGVNIIHQASDEVKVFEAAIDMMSYMELTGDYISNKLVLGMTADNPLEQLLKDWKHIKKISFCLDWDKAGREAVYGKERADGSRRKGLLEKYKEKGYLVRDISKGYTERHLNLEMQKEFKGKDYNELLVYKKLKMLKEFREKNCDELFMYKDGKSQELEQNRVVQEGRRR